MMRVRIGIALIALALSATTIVFGANSPVAQFTADQASHGRTAYTIQCSACHGGDLGGFYAPALAGSASKTALQPPGTVYGYMSVYMPAGNAGAVKQQDYVNIMAFLMQQNGRHPSSTPLTVKAIQGDPTPMSPTH
jgi:polar amino acid transport system substrate-binding protein